MPRPIPDPLPMREPQGWSRQRQAAASNSEAVLRAARALIAETGDADLDVRQVARRAGVGVGTVYRRFTDKAGLLSALVDDAERELQDAILSGPPPLGPGAPPLDRLGAFLDALVALTDEHLDVLIATEAAAPGARLRVGAYAAWHLHVAALVRQLRPDLDVDWLTGLLLAPLDAQLLRRHRRELGRSVSELQGNLRAAAFALVGQYSAATSDARVRTS